jgi:hypothetical protein
MDKEELLFAVLRVGGARGLDHLGKKDGLDVSFVVEDIDAREDGRVLEGAKVLLVSSADVGRGCLSGSGGRLTEVSDVLRGRAIARSSTGS